MLVNQIRFLQTKLFVWSRKTRPYAIVQPSKAYQSKSLWTGLIGVSFFQPIYEEHAMADPALEMYSIHFQNLTRLWISFFKQAFHGNWFPADEMTFMKFGQPGRPVSLHDTINQGRHKCINYWTSHLRQYSFCISSFWPWPYNCESALKYSFECIDTDILRCKPWSYFSKRWCLWCSIKLIDFP